VYRLEHEFFPKATLLILQDKLRHYHAHRGYLLAYKQSLARLAPATQKRYLAAIKSFFAWALDTGIIEKNPAASLKLPRAVANKAPVFLTLDETRLLLNTAKLPRDVALFPSLAYGLRIVAYITASV